MIRTLARILASITLLVLALGAPPAAAAEIPLAKSHIAAEATWILHLDLDAIRSGRLGAALEDCALEDDLDPEQRVQLDRIRPVLERLLAVTLYGEADPKNAVVLLQTSGTADELFAAMQCDITPGQIIEGVIDAGGYTLRSWTVDTETMYGFAEPTPRAEGGPQLVYLSGNSQSLVAAIDTVHGKRPSLAAAAGPLTSAIDTRPGAFIIGAATNLDTLRRGGRAPVMLESTRALRFEAGEHKGEVFSALTLTTDSNDSARQIADIARGLHAMAQIAVSQNPEYARFRTMLQAVAVNNDGSNATLAVTWETDKVIAALTSDRPRRGSTDEPTPKPTPEPAGL